jgi:hypothetical protein
MNGLKLEKPKANEKKRVRLKKHTNYRTMICQHQRSQCLVFVCKLNRSERRCDI